MKQKISIKNILNLIADIFLFHVFKNLDKRKKKLIKISSSVFLLHKLENLIFIASITFHINFI